jgi:hypothetical protein
MAKTLKKKTVSMKATVKTKKRTAKAESLKRVKNVYYFGKGKADWEDKKKTNLN